VTISKTITMLNYSETNGKNFGWEEINSNKIIQSSFGQVSYNKNEDITDDDILYLKLSKKIVFSDIFNKNIDSLPDNIIEIELGLSFDKLISKIPEKLK